MSSQDRSSQVRLSQVRLSQVRTGQVRFGQLRKDQSKDRDQVHICVFGVQYDQKENFNLGLECGPAQSYLLALKMMISNIEYLNFYTLPP